MWEMRERKKSSNSQISGLSNWVKESLKMGVTVPILCWKIKRKIPGRGNKHRAACSLGLKIFLRCGRLQTKINTVYMSGQVWKEEGTGILTLYTSVLFVFFFRFKKIFKENIPNVYT